MVDNMRRTNKFKTKQATDAKSERSRQIKKGKDGILNHNPPNYARLMGGNLDEIERLAATQDNRYEIKDKTTTQYLPNSSSVQHTQMSQDGPTEHID